MSDNIVSEIAQIVSECQLYHKTEIDKLAKEIRDGLDELRDVREALTGTQLHPNGITAKVARIEAKVEANTRRLDAWENRARGLAAGVALAGGALGGIIGAIINSIVL
jgi:septal ring factor EnvC (AmiA/AmiB activator)